VHGLDHGNGISGDRRLVHRPCLAIRPAVRAAIGARHPLKCLLMAASEPIIEQLRRWGPERCEPVTRDEAVAFCRRLARRRRENFSVLSLLVPDAAADDFASVYAFCRWADDLGDEIGEADGGQARSRELLAWWRDELGTCWSGTPRHPVMIALAETVARHDLPRQPFDDLISAFVRDQDQDRYRTWDELLDYCRLSANPVGRIVLMLLGEPRREELFAPSDAICTALQLTNHWQDIRRDRVERNRVYIPTELNPIEDFERRLEISTARGWASDPEFLIQSRQLVCSLVERTWPLYARGRDLLSLVQPPHRGLIWLFSAGGEHVLDSIAAWNYETVLHRPRVSTPIRLWLVMRAWFMSRRAKAARGPGAPPADRVPHAAGGTA